MIGQRPEQLRSLTPAENAQPPVRVVSSLAAPPAIWQQQSDVVIVGTGVAGLATAHALSGHGLRVLLVTKDIVRAGSTQWAQGGVATADAPGDDPDSHWHDTLVAGAGLCDPEAVRVLVQEGPAAVANLVNLGAQFDRDPSGQVSYTLEGGHSHPRIVHSGGDATGLEVQRTLESVVERDPDCQVLQRAFVLDMLRDASGRVRGVRVAIPDAAGDVSVGEIHARAVVLASGGYGQVFASTTNPPVATGDGLAAALRAGAQVADLEFVQFHPTVLAVPAAADAVGRRPLVSEAVRGEGAYLVDGQGERFMLSRHPRAELAPRDVVSAAITEHMTANGTSQVYLDARQIVGVTQRFPTIVAMCRAAGIDPATDLIPVAPAAHYACGGVVADMSGRTSLAGLYAVGEVACTGVHGANRLASNSLLEAMVVARRLGQLLLTGLADSSAVEAGSDHLSVGDDAGGVIRAKHRREVTTAMVQRAGVIRDPESLGLLAQQLEALPCEPAVPASWAEAVADWEMTNIHAIATGLTQAAIARAESRGCHRRADVTEPQQHWRRRIVGVLSGTRSSGANLGSGTLVCAGYLPVTGAES